MVMYRSWSRSGRFASPWRERRIAGLVLVVAFAVAGAVPARAVSSRSEIPEAEAGGFHLSGLSESTVRFAYRGLPTRVERGEDGRLQVEDESAVTAAVTDRLTAPLASAWIALPPGTEAEVRAEYLRLVPLPWPAEMTPAEREAVLASLPGPGWHAEAASWMHNQWGKPIACCPVIADGRGGLAFVAEAEFTVTRSAAKVALRARPSGGRDPFESTYRALFLNYEQGRNWRRADAVAGRAAREEGDWFDSTPNPWIKVRVARRGVYAVTGQSLAPVLAEADLALEDVDPVTLRLFRPRSLPLPEGTDYASVPSWMVEVPIEIAGGGDGTFDPQDAVRFIGQGGDGFFDDLGVDTLLADRHFHDPYDGAAIYWLTWGGTFAGAPRRMEQIDGTELTEPYANIVSDRAHFEENRFWEPRPHPRVDSSSPLPSAWERYWWLSLTATQDDVEQIVRVNPPDPVTDRPVRVRLRFNTTIPSDPSVAWPDHAVVARLNGTTILRTDRLENGDPWDGLERRDADTTGVWLVAGTQELRFHAPYRPFDFPNETRVDNVLFGWVELDYTRRLIAHGDTIAFRAGGPLTLTTQSLEIQGFTTDDVLVYDATDLFAPSRVLPVVVTESGERRVRFRAELPAERPKSYLACSSTRLIAPTLALKTAPEEGWLQRRSEATQLIIVTHDDLRGAAETLAEARRARLPGASGSPDRIGAGVAVVTVGEIYDEFSFGRQDPTAIRHFLQFARDRWDGGQPEDGPAFLTILGDAYYDYRDLQSRGGKNLVPTFEGYWDQSLSDRVYSPQFASDDYYALLDDDAALDLYLGRLPVRTSAEAADVVSKILRYEAEGEEGAWRGRITLVADDLCQGTRADALGAAHMRQSEVLVPLVPAEIQIDRVYLYDFGTACVYDRKPLAAAALLDRMNEGTLIVNFTGHGSDEQIADERVLEMTSVPSLTNADRPFLFFTASCSVGKYDIIGVGLGEALLLHSGGGAIAVFSASAIAYSGENSRMNQFYYQRLFPGADFRDPRPIGEAAVTAKNSPGLLGTLNSKRYVLLGDPVVRLATPRREVDLALERIEPERAIGDTLVRGTAMRVRGRVLDAAGLPDAGYDGDASIRIYDSAARREVSGAGLTYELIGAPIYRAEEVAVVNGEFELPFMVPAALRTGTRGPAKIFAYVSGGESDGGGARPSLLVPEQQAPPSDDVQGPSIELSFLAAAEGTDPIRVPSESGFQAVLEDSSGINITGLVGSRSVVMEIQQDGSLVFLEDLAEAVTFGEDFRHAQVESVLPATLSPGVPYELVLRVSDNLNNSATARLAFVVEGGTGGEFSLRDVFVFPNPSTEGARLFGTINGPADLEVRLFTLAGRRIWSREEFGVSAARFASEGIFWDGLDADGDRPANGVYLYKLTARPVDGGKARSLEGRIVVSR